MSDRKWFTEEIAKALSEPHTNLFLRTWEDMAEYLNNKYVPQGDQDAFNKIKSEPVLYDTQACRYNVAYDSYKILFEKFLLACCYIKELESHSEEQAEQYEKLLNVLIDTRNAQKEFLNDIEKVRNTIV